MATEHKIADADEFDGDGARVIGDVDGREVAVFRIDGDYYALLNYCAHQSGPLCEGELRGRITGGDDGWEWTRTDEGRIVTCPWHGWAYDVRTGENVDGGDVRVPCYEVEERDGEVFVTL